MKLKLLKNNYITNVIILFLGTGLSQIIPLAASPFLARLYNPEAFGLLGSYAALVGILSVFLNGRYDLAIVKPSLIKSSLELTYFTFVTSIFITLLITVIIFVMYFVFNIQFELGYLILFVPISAFLMAQNSTLNTLLNRKKKYKRRGKLLVITNSGYVIYSIIYSFFGSFGLIFGNLSGNLTSFLINFKRLSKTFINQKINKKLILEHKNFPLFILPSTLLEKLSTNLPIIFLFYIFGPVQTGIFVFASKLSSAPIGMICLSIGEVYRQKAADDITNNGNCSRIFYDTRKFLIVLGSIVLLIAFFLSETLFPLIFGPEWIKAGVVVKYFSVMLGLNIISTSLSYSIVFSNFHKYDTLIQLLRLILIIASITIAYLTNDFMLFILAYVLSYSLYYILHSVIQEISIRKLNS
uniref:lipopolysaccharide biosynthesis protein n=1 Tax=Flavobacterium sp. TaxID=239 RepID=UPI00404A328C